MTAQVVVVGGGPVGLACAIFARLQGLSVQLVEAGRADGDKACGEGLMPGAWELLGELGIEPSGYELAGVSYRQGSLRVDHSFPARPGRGVRRLELVSALRERCAELGVPRQRGRVLSVEEDPRGVTLILADESRLRADYVLACDGLHSGIARSLGVRRSQRRVGRRYGLRQHFAIAPWSSLIEVYYAGDTEVYITPVAPDTVGVAVLGGKGMSLEGAINQVPELAKRLDGASPVSELAGAGPFPQKVSTPRTGRVLLVGDAAGYVDAITGEGLRVGFAQAREAVSCLVQGRPERYPRRWRQVTREFRFLTKGLVILARSPLRRSIVPIARAVPWLFGAIVNRLAR